MEFQTLGPRKEEKAREDFWNQGEEVIRVRRKNLVFGARISVFGEKTWIHVETHRSRKI